MPFGYGKFTRVKYDKLSPNPYIKIYRRIGNGMSSMQKGVTAAGLSVSIAQPDILMPVDFQINYIDLTNYTNIQYRFEELVPESPIEQNRYKMILKINYSDAGDFIYEITPTASGIIMMGGPQAPNIWYMGDIYNAGATRLQLNTAFVPYYPASKQNTLLTIDSE